MNEIKKQPADEQPPRWAQRLLSWYCRPDLLEDLQGDLNEYFERNRNKKGIRYARLIYWIDVLKFFRLYTVRKPEYLNLFIQWLMISSYLKTSRRSLVRNKLFSVINIVGLAVSMSVGLLVIAFITDLRSYDEFHTNKDRIQRIMTTYQFLDEPPIYLASTSVKTGRRIQSTLPGIEALTMLRNGFSGDAKLGESVIPVSGLWADNAFFSVFTFPLLAGDAATALKAPYSVVITEKTANKLFGRDDVLGKTLRIDTTNYTVTGVLKDIPNLSHMRFELLISFATAEIQVAKADPNFLNWDNIWSNYVYILFAKNTDLSTWQAKLDRLSDQENKALNGKKITLSLQPLKEIVLGRSLHNSIGPTVMPTSIWILGGLAFVVIISACFNYTNLSIARSIRRSREVGIRKIIGALRSHVLGQFVAESVLIALLALLFSFGLFLFLRTQFITLDPRVGELVSLAISPRLVLYFIGLALAVGLVAGFLPALFFSRIDAIQVIKNASSLKVFRHVSLRKALIVIQYTLSLAFITSVVIGYNQYKNFLTFDLGFSTENILNIKLQNNKGDVVAKELAEIPAVKAVSRSMMITSLGSIHGTSIKYRNPDDSANVWLNLVDEHYLPIHKHRFLAGRNFSLRPRKGEESEVIVNEQVLKRFSIAQRNPAKAIGQMLTVDGKKLAIVGVLKDFHYGTVDQKIEPVLFRYTADESGGYLNVKVVSADLPATLAAIEKAWKKIDKAHPIEAKFYDEQIEQAYSQFSVMVKVIGFIAFLAICIASMGLFGMVVFTTETKLKEVSIRKVLGASEVKLIYLLSKGFLGLLMVASAIALPATYIFFDKVLLINFAYHKPIEFGELVTGVGIVMAIAVLLTGSQTVKVARSNPAQVLKSE